jgi:hypothetical protein
VKVSVRRRNHSEYKEEPIVGIHSLVPQYSDFRKKPLRRINSSEHQEDPQ